MVLSIDLPRIIEKEKLWLEGKMDAVNRVTYVESHGKVLLLFKGFVFKWIMVESRRSYWKCKREGCPARAVVRNSFELINRDQIHHNHRVPPLPELDVFYKDEEMVPPDLMLSEKWFKANYVELGASSSEDDCTDVESWSSDDEEGCMELEVSSSNDEEDCMELEVWSSDDEEDFIGLEVWSADDEDEDTDSMELEMLSSEDEVQEIDLVKETAKARSPYTLKRKWNELSEGTESKLVEKNLKLPLEIVETLNH